MAETNQPNESGSESIQTSGQKWCGCSFNPSGSAVVDKIKQQFADAADTLETWYGQRTDPISDNHRILYESAKADIIRAEMLTVNLFTYDL